MEINGDWNTKEIMHKTAEKFKRETGLNTDREITPEGDFLREWWEINYDILHHSLQMREQVPQQDASTQAEPANGIKEEIINNPHGPEIGTSRNPEELPMYFAESSKTAEHPQQFPSNGGSYWIMESHRRDEVNEPPCARRCSCNTACFSN